MLTDQVLLLVKAFGNRLAVLSSRRKRHTSANGRTRCGSGGHREMGTQNYGSVRNRWRMAELPKGSSALFIDKS